jgi:hypothetical protein
METSNMDDLDKDGLSSKCLLVHPLTGTSVMSELRLKMVFLLNKQATVLMIPRASGVTDSMQRSMERKTVSQLRKTHGLIISHMK